VEHTTSDGQEWQMIHIRQLTKLADDRAQITHSRAAWTACEGISAVEQIGGYSRVGQEQEQSQKVKLSLGGDAAGSPTRRARSAC
jgi:hypothetical protein